MLINWPLVNRQSSTSHSQDTAYLRLIHVVVGTCIRPTHGHDNEIWSGLHEKVVDWWLEPVLVLLGPARKVDGRQDHGGADGHGCVCVCAVVDVRVWSPASNCQRPRVHAL